MLYYDVLDVLQKNAVENFEMLDKNAFFWCYLSSQLTELIDMLPSEEMKISMGTRNVPGMTLGSLWPPGVSALIARVASGPSTVQNSLGRKWDILRVQSGAAEVFVRDETLYRG